MYIKKLLDEGAEVEDFNLEILGEYPEEECLVREKDLARTALYPKGLNGNAGLYIAHTGRKRSEETCRKIGESHKGKVLSAETKKRMSEAKKGKPRPPHSEETIEKIRIGNTGKIVSEETREKIRNAVKYNGYFSSEEGKQMARERNAKLIEEGCHPSQIHQICPHCQKSLPKSAITRWHGEKCKMFSREGKE